MMSPQQNGTEPQTNEVNKKNGIQIYCRRMGKTRKILRRKTNAPKTHPMAQTIHHNPHRQSHATRPSKKTRLQSQTRLHNRTRTSPQRRIKKTTPQIRTQTKTHGRQKIQTRKKHQNDRRRTHSPKIPKPRSTKLLLGRRRRTQQMVRSHTHRPTPPINKSRPKHQLDLPKTTQTQSPQRTNKRRQKSQKPKTPRNRRRKRQTKPKSPRRRKITP